MSEKKYNAAWYSLSTEDAVHRQTISCHAKKEPACSNMSMPREGRNHLPLPVTAALVFGGPRHG